MFIPVLANAITDSIRHPERPLAVFGGIALGAYLSVLLANLLYKRISKKPLPNMVSLSCRTLGGIAGGWIVFIYLFGGGGDGIGGPGGTSNGSNNSNSSAPEVAKSPEKDNQLKKNEPSKVVINLRVLTDESAKKMMQGNYQPKKYYLLSDKPDELFDIESLLTLLNSTLKTSMIERIDFVIGVDDPDRDTNRVRLVRNWAEANKVAVDFLPR
ncbi:MAG: hypothetical protein WCN64_03085 [Planctomycetota bacterium]